MQFFIIIPDLELYFKALLLAFIEGLTEFIPVSSTGHLVIFGDFIGFPKDLSKSFDVIIQGGAVMAVLVLYAERFKDLLVFKKSSFFEERFFGLRGIFLLFLASLPALIFGYLLHDRIEDLLGDPRSVAVALIAGGIILLFIERIKRGTVIDNLDMIKPHQALMVGFFQCLSLWPGFSRSGATIIGGLVGGMQKKLAAEFSFLVAVPVLSAAVGYKLLKVANTLSIDDAKLFGFGFLLSFIFSLMAMKFFIKLLNRFSLAIFGVYRIILGLVVIYFSS